MVEDVEEEEVVVVTLTGTILAVAVTTPVDIPMGMKNLRSKYCCEV